MVFLALSLAGCHPIAPIEFKILLARAEMGDTEAQEEAASMLLCGRRVSCGFGPWLPKCDNTASLKWYQKAAEGGNAKAQTKMGEIYLGRDISLDQLNIQKDIAEARKWFLKAANQNYIPAYMALASIEEKQNNKAGAAIWYKKAAESGDSRAQFILAQMYVAGHGVPKDAQKAHEWALKSAAKFNRDIEIASIYAETYPPDYVEAYYWAGLRVARYKMVLMGKENEALVKYQAIADSYKKYLTPEQITSGDERIAVQIHKICDTRLMQRKTFKSDRRRELHDPEIRFCIELQKKERS